MARPCPAIILAAGASQRLGQPKSLVRIGDTTLVGMAYQKLDKAGCSPIVIVTRSELAFEIMQQTIGSNVLSNPSPEKGRTGSLQCGILSLAGDKGRIPRGVIVAPVTGQDGTFLMSSLSLSRTSLPLLLLKVAKATPFFWITLQSNPF
jgi:CTP:molybdopterin cytidylyltransferase MocA